MAKKSGAASAKKTTKKSKKTSSSDTKVKRAAKKTNSAQKAPKKPASAKKAEKSPAPAPKSVPKPRSKAAKSPATAETMARNQREISVADFFSRNRHLLGFDNPRKALLTAIKEAVDNGLDACEEARILPEISVTIAPFKNSDDRYTVTVEDNGPGIVRKQIPRIFAKLLYGSKFHTLKMSRGQQGMGIAAAGMYGQLTTGQPIRITSRTGPRKPAHYYELHIDTQKNEPKISKEDEIEWEKDHGTRVSIDLEAKYQRGKQSVDDYLQLTAIANPHVTIHYTAPNEETVHFERVVEELPGEPREIKPHPHGLELGVLIKMLHATKSRTLHSFLHNDFCRVSSRVATEICNEAKLSARAYPTRIAKQEADNLFHTIQKTKLYNPPTDCICPIGEDLLLKGLQQGVQADYYECVTRSPSVYRGNPFQIEAGLAYGGDLPSDQSCRILRYANRVPLQYQQGACAVTQAISEMGWKSYGLSQSGSSLPVGPMAIVVHIASVWVPFTSESKEAIAHYPEIIKEVKLALQECGRKLSRFVRSQKRAAEAARKHEYLKRYLPHIAEALGEILDLSEKQKSTVADRLSDVLEKGRK